MKDKDKAKEQLINELVELRQRVAELEESETERERAEEAIKKLLKKIERAKQEWESTADSLDELVCLVDDRGRIIRVNRIVEAWKLGRVVDVEGRGVHELLHPHCTGHSCYLNSFWKKAWEKAIHGKPTQYEAYDEILKRHVLVRVQPWKGFGKGTTVGSTVVTVRDITDNRRLEEQLRHAQKMEAVGTLAGGIAHDFNNLLAGILGYAALIKKCFRKDDPMTTDVEAIESLSWKGSDLTNALLTFSRRGEYRPEPVNISPIAKDVLQVVGRTAGKRVELKADISPNILNAYGDRSQLHQVIMNLCLNACEAMPKGGSLTVRAENAELDEDFFGIHQEMRRRPYIVILISDTGAGMDEKTRERIFEPFFTTRTERPGRGLGLSVVNGIVERHGGCVETKSEPGRGSIFTVYLPATEEKERKAPPMPLASLGGNETILVVDDDVDFRKGIARWLKGLGYSVASAASGEGALKVLEKKKDKVDLVLLDMVMKGMGGAETFWKIREMVPELPVIICTGYSLDNSSQQLIKDNACDFILKPFEHNSLALKIRKVLENR